MEMCKTLFCSTNIDEQVTQSFSKVKQWFSELGGLPLLDEENAEETDILEEEETEDTLEDAHNSSEEKLVISTTWKPFGAFQVHA